MHRTTGAAERAAAPLVRTIASPDGFFFVHTGTGERRMDVYDLRGALRAHAVMSPSMREVRVEGLETGTYLVVESCPTGRWVTRLGLVR